MNWPQHAISETRSAILGLCRASHLLSVVRDSRWRQQRLLILGYHGVSIEDEDHWNPELYVSPALLESRFEMLERGGYSVLALDEAVRLLSVGQLPPRSVALTFDDGMHDFHARAYPVLHAHGLPATVYLTTYYCEFNRPIFALVVSYMLWKSKIRRWRPRQISGFSGDFDLETNRRQALDALVKHAGTGTWGAAEKDDFACEIADSVGVDYGAIKQKRLLHVMNPTEVAELARAGVDFELHTHRHRAPRERRLFDRELLDNRTRIERLTGLPPSHFCYPNGSHNRDHIAWLAQHGIRSATTCEPGMASPRTLPLLLPRFIDTSAVSPLTFEGWLTGVGSWLARRPSNAAVH